MADGRRRRIGGGRGAGRGDNPLYIALTSAERRDPRGFIIPSDQPDFGTATRFVNALIKTGIAVQRATTPFTVGGKTYPANSYVVKTAQAFRPHVLDMFEPQDHPDDIPYPGAPPTAPYDSDRLHAGVSDGRQVRSHPRSIRRAVRARERSSEGSGRTITTSAAPAGYYFSHQANDSFIVLNRLLKAGEEVSWLQNGPLGRGTFYVAAKASTRAIVEQAAVELGVGFQAAATAPAGQKIGCVRRASRCSIRTATTTCHRAGRASSSRTSSSRTTASFRPTSTAADCGEIRRDRVQRRGAPDWWRRGPWRWTRRGAGW